MNKKHFSHATALPYNTGRTLVTLLRDESPAASERILQILQEKKSADMRKMMDQVVRYLQLTFSVPASTASGERSFSALRRVETVLCNRMTQRRVTHLLLLHVHKKAAELHLDAVMKKFVSRTAERNSDLRPPLTSPAQHPLVMPSMKIVNLR
ncbi:hypothetical protein HPB49_001002 [Dermacentor silvarum]|uniref:Uncharacterized protein n=1 Tax=Dermacentor silvarum TaxID=543639 RepID=A0ACB8DM43_DERSI|nr:hypothetical protein HPB49_001002 [Dermacentor silvarum]